MIFAITLLIKENSNFVRPRNMKKSINRTIIHKPSYTKRPAKLRRLPKKKILNCKTLFTLKTFSENYLNLDASLSVKKPNQNAPRRERILSILMTPDERKFKKFISKKRSSSKKSIFEKSIPKQSVAICQGNLFIQISN